MVLLLVRSNIVSANTNQFSFGDIQAIIQIISPVDNESYEGDVSLNVRVTFQAYSHINSTVMPYRDIICFYRLDSNEWRNATLSAVSEPRIHWSWINQIYTIQIDCDYDASLQFLSNGLHSLSVDVKPEDILSFDSRTYRDNNGVDYHYSNSTVDFYISNNSEQTVPADLSEMNEIVIGVATVLTGVIILTVVVASRKRRSSGLAKMGSIDVC
jgi:hypothetical protein